ncbi:MAG: GNAT family N-acetyltransferase [Candidatus Andersenbacteria bacterium]|nr:GNAT family N-acetyltransferase [Candidatus Andersenbacteria bacterium]MBI3250794.1 GNAT family N-acetyltransferase [Candidatus Andersenbacteria bacterium]
MPDIVMVAKPSEYVSKESTYKTLWLTAADFWQNEALVRTHDEVLWQAFRTHGKYQHAVQKADWFAVAVDEAGQYVSSAFVITVSDVWIIEYVMTNPTFEGKGAGSAVMGRIMTEAKKAGSTWAVLNCDPEFREGQLPKFYSKFGFKQS